MAGCCQVPSHYIINTLASSTITVRCIQPVGTEGSYWRHIDRGGDGWVLSGTEPLHHQYPCKQHNHSKVHTTGGNWRILLTTYRQGRWWLGAVRHQAITSSINTLASSTITVRCIQPVGTEGSYWRRINNGGDGWVLSSTEPSHQMLILIDEGLWRRLTTMS